MQQTGADMAKKKTKKQTAAEAFGELPPEVLALGKPMSVHPLGRMGASMEDSPLGWFVMAGLSLVAMIVGLALYLSKTPLGGKAGPEGWLILAGGGLFVALVCGIAGLVIRGRTKTGTPDKDRGLILYPDAVVRFRTGGFEIIPWAEVKELHAPASKTVWTIVANDGREIALPNGVAKHTDAIINICKCVDAVLMPRYMAQIEADKRVMFGPFGVSRRYVYSKDDKLAWTDVTRLEVVNGRLQVRRGGLMAWCDYHLMDYANGFLAGEIVRRLAPPALLAQGGNSQRW
jgi:hypothetical protein